MTINNANLPNLIKLKNNIKEYICIIHTMVKKTSTGTPLKKNADLAKKYKKLSAREHVLHAPDTYIGAVEEDEVQGWIMDDNENMKHKK